MKPLLMLNILRETQIKYPKMWGVKKLETFFFFLEKDSENVLQTEKRTLREREWSSLSIEVQVRG